MIAPPVLTPTVAEIHLDHLRHNIRRLQQQAGVAEVMAVVKADAYGHGAERIVAALRREGVRWFAVATLPEALRLRNAGVHEPLLVFTAPLRAYIPFYARAGLDLTVSSRAIADAVVVAAGLEARLRVHVKVDTGMGRMGLAPDEAAAVVTLLQQTPGVDVVGVWTHLATSDEVDTGFARAQVAQFLDVLKGVPLENAYLHVANSAALYRLPDLLPPGRRALARIGVALFGYMPAADLAEAAGLKQVMTLRTRVTHLKTVAAGTSVSYGRTWTAPRRTRVATLGAGYADGYPRNVSNVAEVGIHGHRYPVAGMVCMDMTMVDLGPPEGPGGAVQVGDEAVLFGVGGPSADELAGWAGTIPYEICCRVSARVPRRYVDEKNK